MKLVLALAFSATLAGTSSCVPLAPPAAALDVAGLSRVRTVHLGEFGGSESADEIREGLRAELFRINRFTPVESAELADAVLAGAVGVSRSTVDGSSHFRAFGILRLIERESGKLIWMHQYRDRRLIAPPIESNPAPQVRMLVGQFSQELHGASAPPSGNR